MGSPYREARARSRSLSPARRSRSPPRRDRSKSPRGRDARGRDLSPVRARSPARVRSPRRSDSRDRDRRKDRSRSRDRRSRSRSRDRRRSRTPPRRRRSSRTPSRSRSRSPRGGGAMYGLPPAGRVPPRVGLQLFVAGINFITNERDLEEKFSRFGKVTESRVVRHPVTRESRGFAFVVMSTDKEAEEAARGMNGRDWNGRRLLVEVARNPR